MPTNLTGRFTFIGIILAICLFLIFPTGNPTKPNLKPGIDMVGGTSLLYEIKGAENITGTNSRAMLEQTMTALKKRVDPEGVRNLVWRPQGDTRLEIQMPLNNTGGEAQKKRDAYVEAQRKLEETNVRVPSVASVIETLKGDERRKQIDLYAMDSKTRAEILGAMASAWDQKQLSIEQNNLQAQAEAELLYEKLQERLWTTNLSSGQVDAALDLKKADDRTARIEELKKASGEFPSRVTAIDNYAKAYREFLTVRDTIDSAAELKRLLKGSGVLEFFILAVPPGSGRTSNISDDEFVTMAQRLQREGPVVKAGDLTRWFVVEKPEEFRSSVAAYNDKYYALVWTTPDKSLTHNESRAHWSLASASTVTGPGGDLQVSFEFDPEGSQRFGDLTTANVGNALAIVLDGRMISAPNINGPIYGHGSITGGGEGGFTAAEAKYLVSTLAAGSLPAQLTDEPIMEQTIEAALGRENLVRGLMSCVVGIVIVTIFMVCYYYLSGIVAIMAVLLNVLIILAAMAMLQATFTLPGVAGIVLTIGMSVDANVLVFERLREEQQRGLTLRMALRNAYDRAFSAIFDGNVTTGITSIFLYWFGSEEVKGFGLTLVIGIAASLFTSLYVTKTIFALLVDHFGVTSLGSLPLTFPKYDKALRPSIDWMSKAWAFYAFSIVVTVVGLTLFTIRAKQGKMMDIEFSSGTTVQFELKPDVKLNRNDIEEIFAKEVGETRLPGVTVIGVGSGGKSFELVTLNGDSRDVKDAVLTALAGKLNLDVPSTFTGVYQAGTTKFASITEALNSVVFPIQAETRSVGPNKRVPSHLRDHIGGAAIVLEDIKPPLGPNAETMIRRRLDEQRMQASATGLQGFRDFNIEAAPDGSWAVILVSDPAVPYNADPAKWQQQLAGPMWTLAQEAVNNPPQLQKVSSFNAQVAGETQTDALLAIGLSIFVIMAYIWLRFGNLVYGTATVVALLHDTFFVIAAIGFSHYVAGTTIGAFFAVDAFRINLTMMAAVLTVMGYSMNDTVVIFDRIRENRGKYGVINRKIINDSINETLSRTLLTGGTTMAMVLVMYIFGGEAIHGFTFALLIGILVGTYSSIAIAAPLLLIGAAREEAAAKAKPQRALQAS